MLYALILAGGVGSRLWPKSRNSLPKQFLNLTGCETMIQTTVRRIAPLVPSERIFVATGERYVNLVKEQLPMLPEKNIIAEISGKNTAPAIALGALHIAQVGPDDVMAVLTADHLIPDEDTFRGAIQAAAEVAETGRLVTLGVTPTGPETGFGYIQRGESIGEYQHQSAYTVQAFLEKPDLKTAQTFYESGEYYWNSGMFIWQVSSLLEGFELYMPSLYTHLRDMAEAIFSQNDLAAAAEIWKRIEPESIDVGLMEKAKNVAMVPLDAGWNDVGSWAALYEELAQSSGDNVAINAEHYPLDSKGILIQGNQKLVVTIGLENVAIIETDDAILICDLNRTQDVKQVVEHLKHTQQTHYL